MHVGLKTKLFGKRKGKEKKKEKKGKKRKKGKEKREKGKKRENENAREREGAGVAMYGQIPGISSHTNIYQKF